MLSEQDLKQIAARGITEEQVSFRPEEFPGVRIVDKRE